MRFDAIDFTNQELDPKIEQVLNGQTRKWGEPLQNQLVYARIPSIFHGAQGDVARARCLAAPRCGPGSTGQPQGRDA
jgi:hypothetical protein